MKNQTIIINTPNNLLSECLRNTLYSESNKVILLNENLDSNIYAKYLSKDNITIIFTDSSLISIENIKLISAFNYTYLIILSSITQNMIIREYMNLGCFGFLSYNATLSDFEECLNSVLENKKYLCPIAKHTFYGPFLDTDNKKKVTEKLSKREIEIIQLVCSGQTSKEIGSALNVSHKTVEVHRHNILKKLNLKNTNALSAFARTFSLIKNQHTSLD